MSIIKMNLRYIRVVNGCEWNEYEQLITDITKLKNPFNGKWYIWNRVRGKSFYKDITHYLVHLSENIIQETSDELREELTSRLELIIHGLIITERSERAKRGFVWGLTKKAPILMIDMIPYMSTDRIKNILLNKEHILSDENLSPFIAVTMTLRNQINDTTNLLETVMEDG